MKSFFMFLVGTVLFFSMFFSSLEKVNYNKQELSGNVVIEDDDDENWEGISLLSIDNSEKV